MKRIISMILILTLMASAMALVSCSTLNDKGNSNTDVTTKNENGDDPTALPKMDFDGYTVKFAVSPVNNGDKTSLAYLSCDADETDGGAIASSVYQRNRKVEELLNVKIEVVYTSQSDEFRSTIMNSVNSGKNEYDVIMSDQSGMRLVVEGCLLNVEQIDNSHIDMNGDWWDSDYIEKMTYADEVFWLAGPLSLTHAGELCCFFVNLDMYDAKLKSTYGDIYDLVRVGKWTLDKLTAMSAVVYDPVNPNAAYASDEDVMGLRVTSSMEKALVVGIGAEMSSKKADGSGVDFTLITQNVVFSKMMDALYKFTNESDKDGIVNGKTYDTESQFVSGKQLFHGATLTDAATIFESAPFETGIIPNPMYNEEQKEYRTSVYGTAQVIGIAQCCQNTEATTATLEYMARLAESKTKDVLYGEILGERYTKDENVAEMVELLNDSKYTDFIMTYELSIIGTYWLGKLSISSMQSVGRHISSYSSVWMNSLERFSAGYVSGTGG